MKWDEKIIVFSEQCICHQVKKKSLISQHVNFTQFYCIRNKPLFLDKSVVLSHARARVQQQLDCSQKKTLKLFCMLSSTFAWVKIRSLKEKCVCAKIFYSIRLLVQDGKEHSKPNGFSMLRPRRTRDQTAKWLSHCNWEYYPSRPPKHVT